MILLRQREHLLDHRDRELVGELRHEIERAALLLASRDRGGLLLEERVTEVAFATEDESAQAVYIDPVQEVSALPTTASPLPTLGFISGLLLAAGLFLRGYRRAA